ncbi:MAG: RHS repeat-associated core domain-containing protein [Syntrophorhabdus sp.]|nr:RHS repeat-associated core domain-containing protein [Syntrophorhabdus sp.]
MKKENLQTGSTTTYFGDAYEKRDLTGIIHVYANGRRIASIRTDGTTLYYHVNHLGSSSVITDDKGNTKETIDYHPFGTYRVRQDLDASFPNTNYTFTGQEDDDETGLYNYNARLYDPELGRFISADSLVPEPGNLQAFNRYSYCVNNPLVYMDPSGHWFGIDDLIEAVIGAIIGAAEAAITGGDIGEGALKGAFSAWVMANTGVYLRDAGIIAITEAGKEVVKNLPVAIAAHVAAGATTGAFSTLVSGGDLGQNMIVGAIPAGMAKGLGNYLPEDLTGNAYADFGMGLAGHAAIGGISGGATAELFGGNFGQGFEQGAMAGAYGYIFNKGGKVIRQGGYKIIKHSANPNSGSKEHMHWGTDPKGRNGGAVNRDGTLRHGDKPPRKVIDLIVSRTGWDLSKLRAVQPTLMFDFQRRAAENIRLGYPPERGNCEIQ